MKNETLLRNPWKNGRFANHRCFCGSEKKLKKCHGLEYTLTQDETEKRRKIFEEWEASKGGLDYYRKLRGEE